MLKLFRISALAALALGATALTAQAQRAKQVGLVAGVDFTNITGCDYTDGTDACYNSPNTTSKTGFVGGLFVGIPVGGGNTWIEPELLYISKGAKYDNPGGTGTETVDYISVPVLFRWNSQPEGGFFFLIGPVINFNISCSDSGDYTVGGTTTSYDDKCSDAEDPELKANTTVGGMVGIGFSKGRLGIEGRWMNDWGHTLTATATNGDETSLDLRNTGWTIMLRLTK